MTGGDSGGLRSWVVGDRMPDTQGGRHCSRWRRWAKAAYEQIPPSWRWLLRPLVCGYRMYDEIRPRFWIGQSQGRDDGLSISVLCVAGTWDRSFVFGEVLGDGYRERCVGRTWLWNLSKVWAKAGTECCAAVVRVRPGVRRLLGSAKWLRIPAWINGEVDLPLPAQVLKSGNVKKDLRKIRKHELDYEVTQDIKKFDDFYHHMFVPHIARAHGRGARIWPREFVLKHFENGELLLVKKGEQSIAGGVISYAEAVPLLALMGVRDGNREFVREGAIGARYHFTFRHLADKGFTKARLGKSRAFLHDGVLRYKKKLGMRLVGPSEGYFYLRVDQDTNASRAFLKANPLILESDGKLYGAVFTEQYADRFVDETFVRLCKEYLHDGMSEVQIVSFDSVGSCGTVPPEWANKVSVRIASDVLGFG